MQANKSWPNCRKESYRIDFYKKAKISKNTILIKNPESVKDWDYDRNGEYTPDIVPPNSNIKYWWK